MEITTLKNSILSFIGNSSCAVRIEGWSGTVSIGLIVGGIVFIAHKKMNGSRHTAVANKMRKEENLDEQLSKVDFLVA